MVTVNHVSKFAGETLTSRTAIRNSGGATASFAVTMGIGRGTGTQQPVWHGSNVIIVSLDPGEQASVDNSLVVPNDESIIGDCDFFVKVLDPQNLGGEPFDVMTAHAAVTVLPQSSGGFGIRCDGGSYARGWPILGSRDDAGRVSGHVWMRVNDASVENTVELAQIRETGGFVVGFYFGMHAGKFQYKVGSSWTPLLASLVQDAWYKVDYAYDRTTNLGELTVRNAAGGILAQAANVPGLQANPPPVINGLVTNMGGSGTGRWADQDDILLLGSGIGAAPLLSLSFDDGNRENYPGLPSYYELSPLAQRP